MPCIFISSAAADFAFLFNAKSSVYFFPGVLDPASFFSSTFADFKTSIGSKVFDFGNGDVRAAWRSGKSFKH